jgi:AcrR family transcriptional regulator
VSRHEKALETRRRVLRAAYDLFCADGYAATTMQAIADRADVAVQTLYFTFHTKGAILTEAVGACIIGFDAWTPVADPIRGPDSGATLLALHEWFPAFEREPDGARALAVFVDAAVTILGRVAPLVAVMAAAEASDPDVKAMGEIGERRRAESYATIIAALAKKGGLRRGLTRPRATDILLTLASAETYQQLSAGRGWSTPACRAWLLDVLTHQLLPTAR